MASHAAQPAPRQVMSPNPSTIIAGSLTDVSPMEGVMSSDQAPTPVLECEQLTAGNSRSPEQNQQFAAYWGEGLIQLTDHIQSSAVELTAFQEAHQTDLQGIQEEVRQHTWVARRMPKGKMSGIELLRVELEHSREQNRWLE